MDEARFTADCSHCFGLCCTALSFERSAQFGHDKVAGAPCQYLEADFRCRIHEQRDALGYGGCEAFDCLGAGQRASAAFAPLNWHRDPAVARRLYARFSQLLSLQEMRQALDTAKTLDLPPALHRQREVYLERVADEAENGAQDVTQAGSSVLADAKSFLRGLAAYIDT